MATSEPMSQERLAQIRRRVESEGQYEPLPSGYAERDRRDLLAEVERQRQEVAWLQAERQQLLDRYEEANKASARAIAAAQATIARMTDVCKRITAGDTCECRSAFGPHEADCIIAQAGAALAEGEAAQ